MCVCTFLQIEAVLLRYCNNQNGDVFKRLRSSLNEETTSSSTAQCTKRCFSLLCERLNKVICVVYITSRPVHTLNYDRPYMSLRGWSLQLVLYSQLRPRSKYGQAVKGRISATFGQRSSVLEPILAN